MRSGLPNKAIVIDGATVRTGSFNFTTNAEFNNADNLLIIQDPDLAALYTANWRAHAAHSHGPECIGLKIGTK